MNSQDKGAGYATLAQDLRNYLGSGELLQHICDILVTKCDDELVQCFKDNSAKWHKTCRDKYNATNLRHRKRKEPCPDVVDNDATSHAKKITRSMGLKSEKNVCFFCDKGFQGGRYEEHLTAASTLKVDQWVRHAALSRAAGYCTPE